MGMRLPTTATDNSQGREGREGREGRGDKIRNPNDFEPELIKVMEYS